MFGKRMRISCQPTKPLAAFLFLAAYIGLMSSGCGRAADTTVEPPAKLQICYLGLTCEPAIFVAYEKGFFKDEGVDVELVKSDWQSLRDGLAEGRFHASYSFIMYLLKPVEMGMDIKLTGGIHTGCLRIQAGAKANFKDIAGLKGKRLGVTHLGSPPFLFASRVLADKGVDPRTGVEWVTLPMSEMAKALEQGRIDALTSAEPFGSMLMAKGQAHSVCDQATDQPYDDEYCCVVAVNGGFARDNPAAAGKVTRALLKGAKWVSVNPSAAAKLAVEKGYVATTMEINAQAIGRLRFEPGVAKARRDVRAAALALKKAGILKAGTDPQELAKKAWQDLDGVTDEWLKGLEVEKVAGGGRPPKLTPAEFAALFTGDCCCAAGACLGCCGDAREARLPLGDGWAQVRPLRLDQDLNPAAGPAIAQADR